MRQWALLALLLVLTASTVQGQENGRADVVKTDHSVVSYNGIGEPYAVAMARVAEAARAAAVDCFGFQMPDAVTINVDRSAETRLFTDGEQTLQLSLSALEHLRRPESSGVYIIYGICHEIAHIAMYRAIPDHSWMTPAAAEGWAHYMGSRLVDAVYAAEGEALWPDAYDYSQDGMLRLERHASLPKQDPTVACALMWKSLADAAGDKNLAPLFAAWGAASLDPAAPSAALEPLLAACPADDAQKVSAWWDASESMLVLVRPKSDFAVMTLRPDELSGNFVELAHDIGPSGGQKSYPGGGHAVRFESPGEGCYLTKIKIHGARYGHPTPPEEDFSVWLCDENYRAISKFSFPYSSFKRAAPEWVELAVTPTKVPRVFVICAAFNPTSDKGVYVHFDRAGTGNSLIGLPGTRMAPFKNGDWMMRAVVEYAAGGDPLRPYSQPEPQPSVQAAAPASSEPTGRE